MNWRHPPLAIFVNGLPTGCGGRGCEPSLQLDRESMADFLEESNTREHVSLPMFQVSCLSCPCVFPIVWCLLLTIVFVLSCVLSMCFPHCLVSLAGNIICTIMCLVHVSSLLSCWQYYLYYLVSTLGHRLEVCWQRCTSNPGRNHDQVGGTNPCQIACVVLNHDLATTWHACLQLEVRVPLVHASMASEFRGWLTTQSLWRW